MDALTAEDLAFLARPLHALGVDPRHREHLSPTPPVRGDLA